MTLGVEVNVRELKWLTDKIAEFDRQLEELKAIEQLWLYDEDDMASDSALGVASQQSVKAYVDASALTEEEVKDFVGGMVTGNTETGITVTYQDGDGTIDFVVDTEWVQDLVGAMVSGNTETGITVTYQDGDGTIDFVVGSGSYIAAEASATDNALVRWDGTGGDNVQNSNATLTDGGVLTIADYIYTPGLRVGGSGDPGTDAKIANSIAIGGTATIYTSGANANNWDCEYNSVAGSLIFISSDKRHKENFNYDIDGLGIVKKLKPVAFKFKKSEKMEFGFLAQESIKAHEYLAWHDEETDKWGISGWRGYAAVLTKAVQELSDKVASLTNELEEVKRDHKNS